MLKGGPNGFFIPFAMKSTIRRHRLLATLWEERVSKILWAAAMAF
jgi:hypothetical protein